MCGPRAETCAPANLTIVRQVTIDNLTYMQPFSFIVLVAHTEVRIFRAWIVDRSAYRISALFRGSRVEWFTQMP